MDQEILGNEYMRSVNQRVDSTRLFLFPMPRRSLPSKVWVDVRSSMIVGSVPYRSDFYVVCTFTSRIEVQTEGSFFQPIEMILRFVGRSG